MVASRWNRSSCKAANALTACLTTGSLSQHCSTKRSHCGSTKYPETQSRVRKRKKSKVLRSRAFDVGFVHKAKGGLETALLGRSVRTYPSHFRPVLVHRLQEGFACVGPCQGPDTTAVKLLVSDYHTSSHLIYLAKAQDQHGDYSLAWIKTRQTHPPYLACYAPSPGFRCEPPRHHSLFARGHLPVHGHPSSGLGTRRRICTNSRMLTHVNKSILSPS